MGLFENEEVAALRAELALLKASQDATKTKSMEAERIGVHSTDKPKTFAEWMKYRKRVGDSQYRSKKVQDQIQRDFGLLGRSAFYGED